MIFYLHAGNVTQPSTGGKSGIAGDRAAAIATEVPTQGSPGADRNRVANRAGWNAAALCSPAGERRVRGNGARR
jgi:hypothetical protein